MTKRPISILPAVRASGANLRTSSSASTRTSWTFAMTFAMTFALASVATIQAAHAQADGPTAEDLEAAKAAYATGAAAYAKDDFASAVDSFKKSYRLSKNPLLLYNIGNALEATGDKKRALFYFKKFLTDTPKGSANRDEAKERAEALHRELAGGDEPPPDKGNGGKGDGDKNGGDKNGGDNQTGDGGDNGSGEATDFGHNVIDDAPPGSPIDVTAVAPKNAGWKVYLFYRGPSASEFTQVEMRPRYNELVARIPANVIAGSSLQYYVEARDIGDEMIARSGKPSSPHLVLIDKSAKARYYPDFDDGSDSPVGPIGQGETGRDTGPNDTRYYAKWGTTGAAIGMVALSATFYFISSDAASSIEGAAVNSNQDTCAQGRPCTPFDDATRGLQDRGKRFETLGNVFFVLGLATGAAAGTLWYLESRKKKSGKVTSVSAAPAIAPNFVGASAQVRF